MQKGLVIPRATFWVVFSPIFAWPFLSHFAETPLLVDVAYFFWMFGFTGTYLWGFLMKGTGREVHSESYGEWHSPASPDKPTSTMSAARPG